MLDEIVGFFSPKAAYQRAAWRQAYKIQRDSERSYDAASRSRANRDWRASNGSADTEIVQDLPTLRARCRQLVRDNPYAASAIRQLTANLVGDGIEARATHADPKIAAQAQDLWLKWAGSRVDGREDFYGVQKLAVRSMIEAGEVLLIWGARNNLPDSTVTVLEGDYLDTNKHETKAGKPRIVAGVEFDADGNRVAYHVLKDHPGDRWPGLVRETRRIPASDVDHVFEATRPGQTRGVPWFAAGARTLREETELSESIRTKKRVEACLAVIVTPSAMSPSGEPLGEVEQQQDGPPITTLRPGSIITTPIGGQVTTVNPSSSGDADAFHRTQLMAVAASLGLPYHLLTGDVGEANYSSLRAATVAFWSVLDDWIWNVLVPHLCAPAFERLMRREALRLREPKLLEVRASWTPPPRAWVDPLKDVKAQILEIRSGLGSLPDALSAKGIDWREHFNEVAEVNKVIDALGLAFDADGRRMTAAGALQPATGHLRPQSAEDED